MKERERLTKLERALIRNRIKYLNRRIDELSDKIRELRKTYGKAAADIMAAEDWKEIKEAEKEMKTLLTDVERG